MAPKKRSGIGDARAYTPRGRTVRDTDAIDRRERPLRTDTPVRKSVPPQRKAVSARKAVPARKKPGRKATPPTRSRTPIKPPKIVVAPPRLGEPKRRLRLATAVSLLLFTIIGLRLIHLQLTDAPAYAATGLKDRLVTDDLPAPRGSIFDRNGNVLVHSVEARLIAVDPELVKDPGATALALQPLLGIPASELLPKLQKSKDELTGKPDRFNFLKRGVDIEEAKRIQDLKLPEIIVDHDERRVAPGDDLAANLIGFTGTDLNGLGGIEARFDELLRGQDGKFVFEVGRQGSLRQAIPGGYQMTTPAKPGSSLKLTVDRDVQYMVQRILADRMRGKDATWAAAVVLDIRTGEVVAQASYPTYSVNNYEASKVSERGDMATSAVMDPGSIHKAIVLSAALQEGVVRPDSTIEIAPNIRKGGENYKDTHPFPSGTQITLPGLMAYSSNVATIKVAEMLGPQKLFDYQRKFGLGEATGIGIPGEAAGLVQAPENWSGSSHGSIPIGLGVAVTPLQMAAVYATVANDGVWVQPKIIKETVGPDGKASPTAPANSHRVISPENAAALRQIMEAVTVVDDATGVTARLAGYRISGKTGTGLQVKDGKYALGEVASFIGMAPADQPRYVIGVFAHTPGGGGGAIAGPAFSAMMNYTLRHFKVPPTSTKPPEFVITA
ncbi:MAG TPA: penicillin-binding protein 2 [Candidatus Limnocylindrales bacterium]